MHRPRHQLKDVLFLFTFDVPLAEFKSMLWTIILHKNKSLTYKPPSRWDRVILQDAVIAGLNHFAITLVQIPEFAVHESHTHTLHNEDFTMLNSWCNTGGCNSFSNSSQHIDPTIWAKDFELWFVSQKDFIPLLYCQFFVCLGPLMPFDIVLVP